MKHSAVLVIAAAMSGLSGLAWAQEQASPIPASNLTLTPKGRTKPLSLYYPMLASQTETGGWGIVDCLVAKRRDLTDCHVVEEQPKEFGFGEAALRYAADTRVGPMTKDGKPTVGARVVIPLRFSIP